LLAHLISVTVCTTNSIQLFQSKVKIRKCNQNPPHVTDSTDKYYIQSINNYLVSLLIRYRGRKAGKLKLHLQGLSLRGEADSLSRSWFEAEALHLIQIPPT